MEKRREFLWERNKDGWQLSKGGCDLSVCRRTWQPELNRFIPTTLVYHRVASEKEIQGILEDRNQECWKWWIEGNCLLDISDPRIFRFCHFNMKERFRVWRNGKEASRIQQRREVKHWLKTERWIPKTVFAGPSPELWQPRLEPPGKRRKDSCLEKLAWLKIKKTSSNSPWSLRKRAKGQLLACSSFEGSAVDGLQGRTEVPVSLSLPFLKYNRKAKDHERVEAAFLHKRQRLTQMSWKRGPRGGNCAGSQRNLESLINIFRKIWEDTVARTQNRGLWKSGDRENRLKLVIWKYNF